MEYILSKKYELPQFQSKIMGPNPVKLTEELMRDNYTPSGSIVCDLGSGQGLTSLFLHKEYGYKVYAADLWSDPTENDKFFRQQGALKDKLIAVKADATELPFKKELFDAVVCVDSYNYFGRDKLYLDNKLLPFIKSGGYVYLAITGMKKDIHDNLPAELLLSWSREQLDYIRDIEYWRDIFKSSTNSQIVSISQMESNKEVWEDWIKQDNQYSINDRKSIEAGALKYLNFIKVVLRKK